MFRIELLPARHGDAIWIEYGSRRSPRRIIIDGGPASSYATGLGNRIRMLPPGKRRIDLLIITHIDADHIDGPIIFLQEANDLGVQLGEVWFNGWQHIKGSDSATYAPLQGEFLGGLLALGDVLQPKWNATFGHQAIVVPDQGPSTHELPDGAQLTLLSPGPFQLKRLRARWASAIRDFTPGDATEASRRLKERRDYKPPQVPAVFAARTFGDDRAVANGSSIAFIIEFEGHSCLFGADAHPRVLAASLRYLTEQRGVKRLSLDLVKLPHHGSMSNIDDAVLSLIDCSQWLISTNGANFDHPDQSIARFIAERSPQEIRFLCNYHVHSTQRLANEGGVKKEQIVYPGDGADQGPAGGLMIDVAGLPRVRMRADLVSPPSSGPGTRQRTRRKI
jgi:hypothetical protein